MSAEVNPDESKAQNVSKTDPEYKVKVSDILTKRFELEKLKAVQRTEEKKLEQKKKISGLTDTKEPTTSEVPENAASRVDRNINPVVPIPGTPIADSKDPEEFVKRKDIIALVNQLNKSFAIIEKFRVETEEVLKKFKEVFKS